MSSVSLCATSACAISALPFGRPQWVSRRRSGAAVYCVFLLWMLRSDRRTLWIWDGVGFVLYSIVEPHAVKSGLISLGPALLTAGCLYSLASEQPPRRGRAALANTLFIAVC